jgi:hypothetical protein
MLAKIAQTNINGERTALGRVDKLLLTSMHQRWRLELTSGVLTPPPTSSYSLQQSQQYITREYVSSTTFIILLGMSHTQKVAMVGTQARTPPARRCTRACVAAHALGL